MSGATPQTPDRFDVVGIGNAMVDIISLVEESFIVDQELVKGSMRLIDEAIAEQLTLLVSAEVEASGGSAANTMAGIASFGGTPSYIGKVSEDRLGGVFIKEMANLGVSFEVAPATVGPATGRCLILVTPDAQRTLNTFLGVSSLLASDDVDPATVEAGKILFCEGYIWDMDASKQAIRLAMEVAAAAGRKVALTLSDTFCVERHHQEFLELVAGPVDILFANEVELCALYQCDLDQAVERVAAQVELACVTLGPRGSWLFSQGQRIEVPAEEIGPVVDTTGAGDQYAAGVLYGLSQGMPLAECGRLGSLAAAEVISHLGPRPERSLADFLT